uniref:Ubiquitin carboxyl-terminal hydrolase n=1 Tax=Xiphophorus maculatus TaxID=8083 RepID=M3ZIW1_XIPMA
DWTCSAPSVRPERIWGRCVHARLLGGPSHRLHQHVCAPHSAETGLRTNSSSAGVHQGSGLSAGRRQQHGCARPGTTEQQLQPGNHKSFKAKVNHVCLIGKPGVVGLDNIGNSCYFNAVMQCLCSTMPFVEDLLSQETRRELAKYAAAHKPPLLSCSPVQVMSTLPSVFPQFDSYTQQDAQELLLHLLDALHEDLKKRYANKIRSSKTESTIVSDLFEGQLSYLTSFLHCGHEARNSQTFTILSLPIPNGALLVCVSVQDCLSLFFEETVLTGAEQTYCSDCGLRREATVQTYLNKPPEILILHLKRWVRTSSKNTIAVILKFLLNSLNWISVRSWSSYHLYAVVIHRGNLDMGHYTALCYNSVLETWHWFDDSLVKEVHGSVVQSPDAYVLFYSCDPF